MTELEAKARDALEDALGEYGFRIKLAVPERKGVVFFEATQGDGPSYAFVFQDMWFDGAGAVICAEGWVEPIAPLGIWKTLWAQASTVGEAA